MIDHRQLRAARAILGFSLVEAGKAAGVSVSAVVRAERADQVHDHALVGQLQRGYELGGVTFTNAAGTAGVNFLTQ